MVRFYDRHYSSNLMRLAVLSRMELDELQEVVVDRFSQVRWAPRSWTIRVATQCLNSRISPRGLSVKYCTYRRAGLGCRRWSFLCCE